MASASMTGKARPQARVGSATRRTPSVGGHTKHLPELDALRGLAALVVLLNHFHETWLRTTHPTWLARPRLNPPLWLLVNGHSSVILFFLLSGFVLSLPRLHGSTPSYFVYALRRICRIYLPYLAALLLSLLACGAFFHLRLDGGLLPEFWRQPPDAHSLLQHLIMLRRMDVYRYDGPVWSLVHEMRISLVFPVILFCALRLRAVTTFLLAAGCAVAGSITLALMERNVPGEVRMVAWSWTLSYCGIFLLGAGLALRYDAFIHLVDRLSPAKKSALFTAAMFLYLYPLPEWHRVGMGDLSIACGGLVLLTFALRQHGMAARLLRLRPMQFLGTVSYSLYLLHFPILIVISSLRSPRLSYGWLLLPYLVVSMLAAVAMHRLVEMPSMALGRRVRDLPLPALTGLALGPRSHPQT